MSLNNKEIYFNKCLNVYQLIEQSNNYNNKSTIHKGNIYILYK